MDQLIQIMSDEKVILSEVRGGWVDDITSELSEVLCVFERHWSCFFSWSMFGENYTVNLGKDWYIPSNYL